MSLKSFRNAFNGIKMLLSDGGNIRVHFIAAAGAITAGIIFRISLSEWIAIIIVSCLVIALEAVNSSVEELADFVSPEKHEQIKKIKDISAAAVLIASVAALLAGLIIFIPEIIEIF